MLKQINTAIIGFGKSAKIFQAPFLHIHSGFNLITVVERHARESQKKYPYVNVLTDYRQMLKDKTIELVVICTPNNLHYKMAKDCLTAGKHVIIEKPFTTTASQADKLIKIAEKKQRSIFVFHNRRWDGDFMTIKRIIDEKILGNIYEFEAHFDRYRPELKPDVWREKNIAGSGLLYDLGSHLIDQALYLFGHPIGLKADIQSQRKGNIVDDYFCIELIYSELKVVLTAGMLVKEHHLRYLVKGHKGTYKKLGTDPQEEALKQGKMPVGNDWGKEDKNNWGLMDTAIDGQHFLHSIETLPGNYMVFFDNVYDVLVNNAEMLVKPNEARNVIKIIEMAFEQTKK